MTEIPIEYGSGCGDPDCQCVDVIAVNRSTITIRRGPSDEDASQDR